MEQDQLRPIFIVGMPRSGSTVFYETLARHPDLAWISKITRKAPSSLLLCRALLLLRSDHVPVEAGSMWDRFVARDDDTLTRHDARPAHRRFLRRVVRNHLTLQGKPRFLNKCPRNGLRIGFLKEIFPAAVFVHLVRDGRAVVQSVLRMRETHGGREAWWDVKPPDWRLLATLPPLEAIARQWVSTVTLTRTYGRALDDGAYLECRYEDFVADPIPTIDRVARACDLVWDEAALTHAVRGIQTQNHKWRQAFDPEQIAVLDSILSATMESFGYDH